MNVSKGDKVSVTSTCIATGERNPFEGLDGEIDEAWGGVTHAGYDVVVSLDANPAAAMLVAQDQKLTAAQYLDMFAESELLRGDRVLLEFNSDDELIRV